MNFKYETTIYSYSCTKKGHQRERKRYLKKKIYIVTKGSTHIFLPPHSVFVLGLCTLTVDHVWKDRHLHQTNVFQ